MKKTNFIDNDIICLFFITIFFGLISYFMLCETPTSCMKYNKPSINEVDHKKVNFIYV